MNKCTYCGAALKDGATSFCSKCGKKLSGIGKGPRSHWRHLWGGIKSARRNTQTDKNKALGPPEGAYDGYYNDIPAADSDQIHKTGVDRVLVLKIVFLIVGIAMAVVAGISILFLL